MATRIRSPKLRIRSPSLHRKQSSKSKSVEFDEQRVEFLGHGLENIGGGNGNKVMVVVDSTLQAKGALDWALSHTVQSQDTMVLLYVTKPSKHTGPDSNKKAANLRAYELLHSMKNVCQSKRPGVEVEIDIREGKEKGPIIVEEAKQRRVSLLVLGQRKRSIMWRLMRRLGGRRNSSCGAADYCIQNSSCMTIAVRRKGKKLGGYSITTKRHKKFWLLA
ncbi:Adenine nucleotide alpha hydrolases-like superfamily protein [Euphorbia peplus]|nr:Adenine nucleotide alpha hydrolases-like superfamily protein [Euphorbia peplus]